MASTTQLAWRNLGRNRRRTLITATGLAVGTMLCVGTYGLMDGMLLSMVDALTRFDLGHVQAHHPRFLERRTLELTLDKGKSLAAVMANDRDIEAVAPRVHGFALASKGDKSRGVQLLGIDPKKERRVTSLHKQLVTGNYVAEEPTPWPSGRELTAKERAQDKALTQRASKRIEDELDGLEELGGAAKAPKPRAATAPASSPATMPSGRGKSQHLAALISPPPERPPQVVIGKSLARTLKATVGDAIYLVGSTVTGASAEVSVRVRGILATGTETFDRRVYLHIADLQRFARLEGRLHELAARVRRGVVAKEVSARLRTKTATPAIQSWDEIRPDMRKMIDVSRVSSMVMVFIVLFIAILGVVNTMLMSVFERTRELGVLKAIGMSAGRILRLIVVETVLLALTAGVVGTVLGVFLDLYLLKVGIDLTGLMNTSMAGIAMDPILRAAITPEGLLVPVLTLVATSLVASLYPALRAARLRPAVGMREL